MIKRIYFVTLAMNQTEFFAHISDQLSEFGIDSRFVCFDEKSHSWLDKQGYNSINVFERMDFVQPADIKDYEIDNIAELLLHEKAYYNIDNEERQKKKLGKYLSIMTCEFERIDPLTCCVVQEFGGFLSVASVFYAARRAGIVNYFIEPSFYRGRVFINKNTYKACKVSIKDKTEVSDTVSKILDDLVGEKPIVIPVKDRHHYRSSIQKIFDMRNMKRLIEKIVYKHILRKQEEFQYIWVHVSRHIQMAMNRYRMKDRYESVPENGLFFYYPMHVQNDASLTIRSPDYYDQMSMLNSIASSMPDSYKLLIKEHPALVGAYDYNKMNELLETHDNISLLHPGINNYDVVSRATGIITVNSKAGAEALLMGKSVIVLGDAFYTDSPDVIRCERIEDLTESIATIISGIHKVQVNRVREYFQAVWNASYPGELYANNNQSSINDFSASLIKAVNT